MNPISKKHMFQFFTHEMQECMDDVTEELTAEWGMMTPQHMVEHLVFALRMSNGNLKEAVYTPEEKLPKYLLFLDTDMAMTHNYKSPVMPREELMPLQFADLAEAKAAFWQEWADFEDMFSDFPDAETNNPVYGALNHEQWLKLHYKHFVHHFVQFGLTTYEENGLKTM